MLVDVWLGKVSKGYEWSLNGCKGSANVVVVVAQALLQPPMNPCLLVSLNFGSKAPWNLWFKLGRDPSQN